MYAFWIAPEVPDGNRQPSPSSDIFSLGNVVKYVLRKALCMNFIATNSITYSIESCLISVLVLRHRNAQTVAANLVV
jgi:serine/threonine protein kinase